MITKRFDLAKLHPELFRVADRTDRRTIDYLRLFKPRTKKEFGVDKN
ncbi:hypothetical protein MFUM_770002 [Methylacidiphilum fumariolicum SolV]|uniref:Uncharacterized protein n=2 Tax=Candidatus Methylacidiphilum fumarolicum TaxID=591154 RepID=I0JZS7_METFB|nr:hypothetical protein [Candidatus Methylacidiphilum fumarolicum]CAI9086114.1 conserved protein of unknown function [Candidatus Methylacidiphilum fumarolicum]CCG92746.1 hypothetical protein MFUM_770002 [Methylacidiphilum fumariolicum SolV]